MLTGAADAATVEELVDRLGENNQIPISVDELNFDGTVKGMSFIDKVNEGLLRMQKRAPYKDVVFFTRQLATMINAGVPLAHALVQLAQSEKPVFRRILLQVADDISMGSTFSDAIARHPGAFNQMYVSVVHSGEIAGALDEVLDQLATYMENVQAMRQKVKGAMRYPVVISIFVLGLMLLILMKLVPTFEDLYNNLGAELPVPTQILMAVSHAVQDHFLLVMAGLIAAVLGFMAAMTNDSFKAFVHKYILKFPVFGQILRKNIYATLCRTLALLIDAGTPILQAIEIGGAVVRNKVYAKSLERVYARLRTGELLSSAMSETGQFPVLITQLIATGEASGKVDDLLRKAAEFYEREIRVTVDSLAAIIEPFLIVILGTIVGSILIALYLPIMMIGKYIR